MRSLTNARNQIVADIAGKEFATEFSNLLVLRAVFTELFLILVNIPQIDKYRAEFVKNRASIQSGCYSAFMDFVSKLPSAKMKLQLFSSHPQLDETVESVSDEVMIEVIDGIATSVEQWISGSESIAHRIMLLGALYETLQDKSVRKSRGVFYTPPALADLICMKALQGYDFALNGSASFTTESFQNLMNIRVLDSSCGGGVFLVSMYNRIAGLLKNAWASLNHDQELSVVTGMDSKHHISHHVLSRNIFGTDLEPGAIEITEAQLWLMHSQESVVENGPLFKPNLRVADSLLTTLPEEQAFDLIVGNPPYIRLSSLDKEYRSTLKCKYPDIFNEYNIHALFVQASLNILKPGGVLGYLVHKNLFSLDTYTELRRNLLKTIQCLNLIDCGPGIFRGVTAETGILIIRKLPPDENSIIQLAQFNTTDNNLITNNEISQEEYSRLIETWNHRFLLSISDDDRKFLEKLYFLPQLKQFASIKRGIETGSNKKFLSTLRNKSGTWLPILRGRDVFQYKAQNETLIDYNRDLLSKPGQIGLQELPKVILQQNSRFPIAFYDKGDYLTLNSTTYISDVEEDHLKSLCVFLNSELIAWLFRKVMTNNASVTVNILPNNLGLVPIPVGYDSDLFSKLCDFLSSQRTGIADADSNEEHFMMWHRQIVEAAVLEAYLPSLLPEKQMTKTLQQTLNEKRRPIKEALLSSYEGLNEIAMSVLKNPALDSLRYY
ncbi:MAG: Eco57I restriction-modification methylase domain-containing protein [Candidatus Thorarchaeota archaeon]